LKYVLFFVLALNLSCGHSNKQCQVSANDGTMVSCQDLQNPATALTTESEFPVDPATGVPPEALYFEANLNLVNFNQEQEEKIRTAVDLIKKVIASKEFREEVLNHSYNGEKTFVDNGGLSNLKIYEKIIAGAEKLSPAQNHALDAEIELYYDTSNTIGYTYPSSRRIWMNTKYFDQYTPVRVSDNLIHEWMHKLGFNHAANYTASRNFSVPYAIGYMVERLAKQYYRP
jgi:hypothetical protein